MYKLFYQSVFFVFTLVSALFVSCANAVVKPSIKVVTEFMPPLQMAKSGHKIHGKVAQLVQAVTKDTGLPHSIDVFPWARSYLWATTKPNVLIFPIIRTKEREDKFHWVGRVWSFSAQMYRLKGRKPIEINKLEDAKNYNIAVYRDDFFHRYLLAQGFNESNLYPAAGIEQSINLFLNKRVDLILVDSSIFEYYLKQYQRDIDEVESLFTLKNVKQNDAYIALSKSTEPSIVELFKQSYQRVATSPEFADSLRDTVAVSANTQ